MVRGSMLVALASPPRRIAVRVRPARAVVRGEQKPPRVRPVAADVIIMPATLPVPARGRTRVVVLGQPAPAPRYAAPTPFLFGEGAVSVGVIATGGTALTMTPANLLIGPVANIADFTITMLDAGSY